jgi:hypothetical protein
MDFISELIDEVIESIVEERWLPIVEYEGLYEVSDLGRVKSLARKGTLGGIMKPNLLKGYLRVHLHNNNSCKIMVHRLVLEAFLPMEEKEVDHINNIRTDNRLINLRWATSSENARHKNKKANCSSIYKGVCWDKQKNKWTAQCKNKKQTHLGAFNDEQDAAKAYNAYIITNNLQEFAVLNDV